MGTSLRRILEEKDQEVFVGRSREIGMLHGAQAKASESPAVVYVYGPEAVGKSALVRAFLRTVEDGGALTLHVDVKHMELSRRGVVEHLMGLTGQATAEQQPVSSGSLVDALNRMATESGLVWAMDHYDFLGELEPWFREEILYRVQPGVMLILSGRKMPTQLWPADRVWRNFVTSVPLRNLGTREARELLGQVGLADDVVVCEVQAVSLGRPDILVAVGEALAEESIVAALSVEGDAVERRRLSSFLVERLLHPGSRRVAWRAGKDSSLTDQALAAAAVLPFFDRGSLAAAVGRSAAEEGWSALMRLPGLAIKDERYWLPPDLRGRMREIVLERRPWASLHWRREAMRHVVESTGVYGQGKGAWDSWEVAAAQVQERVDVSEGHAQTVWRVRRVLEGMGALVAEAAGGGEGARLEMTERSTPGGMETLWRLHVHQEGAAWALLGRAFAFVADVERVTIGLFGQHRETLGEMLACLGFTREGEGWTLAPHGDLGAWLELSMTPKEGPIPAGQWARAAKEALQAISRPAALPATRAFAHHRWLFGKADAPQVTAWILDALQTADLGEVPCSGKVLLTLYYVDRLGSHESIAEYLNLPRTTYFRVHNQVLRRLGRALFDLS